MTTVLRPDFCARLASIAARANSLQGSGIYRVDDLVKTVKEWQQDTVLKYVSTPHHPTTVRGGSGGSARDREETVHCGATSLVGQPDAAFREQLLEGRCRLGYVFGLMSFSLVDSQLRRETG